MKRMFKAISLFAVGTMVFGLTACSTKTVNNTSPTPTITLLASSCGGIGGKLGEQNDPVTKQIEKKLGIKLSIYKNDANTDPITVTTMIAANDLADVMFIGLSPSQAMLAIQANELLPLDSLVAKDAPNINANSDLKARLNISREELGGSDKSKLMAIMLWGGTGLDATPDGGPYIRWDLYKQLGYPKVDNIDDLVNVLSAMQKLQPTTKDGKKVYAAGGEFADGVGWGEYPLCNMLNGSRGIDATDNGMFNVDISTNTPLSDGLTDPNSNFWLNIEFSNKLYRARLLDPDSSTQKDDDFNAKLSNGQYLLDCQGWTDRALKTDLAKAGYSDAAMVCLPPFSTDSGSVSLGWESVGGGFFYGIAKTCKNPDKAMQLLDYVSSAEGSRLVWSGVQGQAWDMVNGVPTMTSSYLNDKKSLDPNALLEKYGATVYGHFSGYALNVISPKDHEAFDLTQSQAYMSQNYNATEKDAMSHYGATSMTGIYIKKGKSLTYITDYTNFPKEPDNISTIGANVDTYEYANIFKNVYANSDSAYQSQKNVFIAGVKKMGVDQVYNWKLDQFNMLKAKWSPQDGPLQKTFEQQILNDILK